MNSKIVYLSKDKKRWTLQDTSLKPKEVTSDLEKKGISIEGNAKQFLEKAPPENTLYELVLLEISDTTLKGKITRNEFLEIAEVRGLNPCAPRAPFLLREAYTDQEEKETITIFVNSDKKFAPYFNLSNNNGTLIISCGYSINTKPWDTNLIVFQKNKNLF